MFGLADGIICVQGTEIDKVWETLHREAGKSDPKYFGYKGALVRFQKFFPNGFHFDGFNSQERAYTLAAKEKLEALAPLSDTLEGSGFGEAIFLVYRSTNMLSPFEKTRLQDVLRGKDSDAIVQALAKFTVKNDPSSLLNLAAKLKPYDCAKWTVVTYLPFLWQPETHMFLKPEETKDYAIRVCHPLAAIYCAQLTYETYVSPIDLAVQTKRELKVLAPRERIDIQSFIWVVGDYQEGRESVYP